MPRLLPPGVQLPPGQLGAVRARDLQLRRPAAHPSASASASSPRATTTRARPGTGYKEYARAQMTGGARRARRSWRRASHPRPPKRTTSRVRRRSIHDASTGIQRVPAARLRAAGVVLHDRRAGRRAHRRARPRRDLGALKRREVYGTSGDRILLWFDLLNGARGQPADGLARSRSARRRASACAPSARRSSCRAVPTYATSAVGRSGSTALCRGECYNPSDERRAITRIEVVRIRPQSDPASRSRR